jgi:hypothetical protein
VYGGIEGEQAWIMGIYVSDVQKVEPERITGKSRDVGLVTISHNTSRLAPFI